ncbi:hypothetical protein [Scytonema hofmannii]|uniref:hypothetical protein n=1 Tax=Scytonema hofmannii TaxID=34078 RepID=UPI00034DE622|nr:hypothetical protein [Scytonema hofmannii]
MVNNNSTTIALFFFQVFSLHLEHRFSNKRSHLPYDRLAASRTQLIAPRGG